MRTVAAHEGKGKSWEAVWHDTDFYGAVCEALDPPTGDDGSSVDDDGASDGETEEDGSGEEDDGDEEVEPVGVDVDDEEENNDEYPAEMLDDVLEADPDA